MSNATTSRTLQKKRLQLLLNVLIGLSPVVSFLFVRPEWVARLVAITGSFLIFSFLLCFYCFNPKTNFSWTEPKLGHEKAWQIKEWILRIIVIVFAVSLLKFLVLPEIWDCFQVVQKGRPQLLELQGTVQRNHFTLGAYFLGQNLIVVDDKNREYILSLYFSQQFARIGVRYKFLIMPKSKIILEWASE